MSCILIFYADKSPTNLETMEKNSADIVRNLPDAPSISSRNRTWGARNRLQSVVRVFSAVKLRSRKGED